MCCGVISAVYLKGKSSNVKDRKGLAEVYMDQILLPNTPLPRQGRTKCQIKRRMIGDFFRHLFKLIDLNLNHSNGHGSIYT